jgi:hypothetical protein
MRTFIRVGLAVLCGLVWTGLASAAPLPEQKKLTAEELAKAEKAVKDYLEEMKAGFGMLQPLKDDRLEKLFPRHAFFTLLFRQFPVGRVPPKGFVVSNILVADAQGKVTLFTSASPQLMELFNANLPATKTEDQAKDVAKAWVRLIQEFSQDGFYKFALMDDATKVTTDGTTKKASAAAVVMQGGSGTVSIALTFDDTGKIAKTENSAMLRPGPRPICQATKLLDPDPLVRRIVEQDLMIMGVAAKPYLDEQRAKASPELQKAIDRIWQRIVDAESK